MPVVSRRETNHPASCPVGMNTFCLLHSRAHSPAQALHVVLNAETFSPPSCCCKNPLFHQDLQWELARTHGHLCQVPLLDDGLLFRR